jgi:hypothetical protein
MLFSQQQMRMKTSIPPHLNPLPLGERKAREMGEGEDEGDYLLSTTHYSLYL